MKTYLLNLYYPNARQHIKELELSKTLVEEIAAKNWRVLRAGESICSIAFETDYDPLLLHKQFQSLGSEQFQFLVLEISAIRAGRADESVYKWIESSLRRTSSQ